MSDGAQFGPIRRSELRKPDGGGEANVRAYARKSQAMSFLRKPIDEHVRKGISAQLFASGVISFVSSTKMAADIATTATDPTF